MEISASGGTRDVKQTAETFVLKKAMEVAEKSMTTLLQSVEQSAAASSNPEHLGQHVDVRA